MQVVFTSLLIGLAACAYAQDVVYRGTQTTFKASARVKGNSTVQKLYNGCIVYDGSGTSVQKSDKCITTLFSHLLIGVGVAPSGNSVASARSGFGNVVISIGDTERFLPTNYSYFHIDGGLKVQAHERNGSTSSGFVADLEMFARHFTSVTDDAVGFAHSDSWRYTICDRAGQMLTYGLVIAEQGGFAPNEEDLVPPTCASDSLAQLQSQPSITANESRSDVDKTGQRFDPPNKILPKLIR